MQLLRLSATGLKTKSFTYAFSRAVAIIGPNFAGKSAIVQALVLLFKGWLPGVGKKLSATWELANGQEMSVTGEFDEADPGTLTRRFWLEGSSVKSELRMGKAKLPIASAGEFENIPLLDGDEYFGLSDNDRTTYVFRQIKLPDIYTADAIIAEVERISLEEDHTEQAEKAKKSLLVAVRTAFTEENTIQDSLTHILGVMKERYTYWNRRARETQGAVKTLTELKLREDEISTDSMAQLGTEIEDIQGELAKVNNEKGKLTAQRDEAERNAGHIRRIRQQLTGDQLDYPRMIESLREDIKSARKKLKPELEKAARENLLGAIRAVKDERSDVLARVSEWGLARAEVAEQIEGLEGMKCCPYCHSKGKDWKSTLSAELTQKLEKLDRDLVEGRKIAGEKDSAIEKMEKSLREFDEIAQANVKVNADIARWVHEVELKEQGQKDDTEKRARWQTDLDERLAAELPVPGQGEIEKLEESRLELAANLSRLGARKEAALRLQHDLQRAAEAQMEHLDAAAHLAMVKAIAKVLNEKREAIIAEVFQTLLVTANMVCGEILRTPLALHENTIGRWSDEGTKFILHRVMSGTERALAYLSIATALSTQAPIRIPILDEFGRLDEDNQRALIDAMDALVEKDIIDQFIIVGTGLPGGHDWDIEPCNKRLQVIEVEP